MTDANPPNDPRWGQQGRDKKAEAILNTLELALPDRHDLRQGTWLDIGCGSGGIAATLAQYVERVIGVDLETWDRWQSFQQAHANLTLKQGSYRDLPELLANEPVDVVVCNQVYEHVDDPVELLKAIHQVLKPDGVCYFAGPNLLWPIEPHLNWPFAHWLPRKWVMSLIHFAKATWAYKWDAKPWSWYRLAKTFEKCGFNYSSELWCRIQADVISRNLAVRLIKASPRFTYPIITPIAPAFIIMLVKKKRKE